MKKSPIVKNPCLQIRILRFKERKELSHSTLVFKWHKPHITAHVLSLYSSVSVPAQHFGIEFCQVTELYFCFQSRAPCLKLTPRSQEIVAGQFCPDVLRRTLHFSKGALLGFSQPYFHFTLPTFCFLRFT